MSNAQDTDDGRRTLSALLGFLDEHGAWTGNDQLLATCLTGFRQVCRTLSPCSLA